MADKIKLYVYLLTVVLLTLVHSAVFYTAVLLVLFFLSGRGFVFILKKSTGVVAFFAGTVSIFYTALYGLDVEYLTLLNLRVFTITFLTFLFIKKTDLFKALDFSKTLTFLLVVSYSQILSFKKYYTEFSMALKSRTVKKLSFREKYLFSKSSAGFFLDKSLKNSQEIAAAMKSRGFFIE
ncbi:hypothetical protein [Persephonella sp.]